MQSPHKILVVDDCPMNRHLFKASLLSADYEVDECSSGADCLAYLSCNPLPCLILLDIMMPGMSGFEALQEIRARHVADVLPVIIVSAIAESGDIVRGLTSGANDYITKPIERATFLARVTNHVNMSSARRALDEHRVMLAELLKVQGAIGDVMREALLVHRLDGSTVYANSPLKELCGGEIPVTIDDALDVLLTPEVKSIAWRMSREGESSGPHGFEREFQTYYPDYKAMVVRCRLIQLEQGETLRLWAFEDVTEVRLLEERMQLQIQLDAVDKFVQGAAHNFNNIFSGILGSSNLLRRWSNENPKAVTCLNAIDRSVDAGTRFIEKMTSMVATRAVDADEPQDIGEMLRVLVDSAQMGSGDRITFILETDQELPPVPFGAHNLAEIFGNVLNNAVDSIPGSGVVRIVARKDETSGKVNVEVKDTGCGMEAETVRRVHEPFFSTKKVDIRHGVSCEGRGLGMWNVFNLVRSFGGSVALESIPGTGTSVRVSLPTEAHEAGTHP